MLQVQSTICYWDWLFLLFAFFFDYFAEEASGWPKVIKIDIEIVDIVGLELPFCRRACACEFYTLFKKTWKPKGRTMDSIVILLFFCCPFVMFSSHLMSPSTRAFYKRARKREETENRPDMPTAASGWFSFHFCISSPIENTFEWK